MDSLQAEHVPYLVKQLFHFSYSPLPKLLEGITHAACTMAKLQIAALLALFAVSAVSAADSIFNEAEAMVVPHAQYNEKLQKFEFWNETVEPMSRRKSLGIGSSSPVTVTFYNTPGMDCTTGKATHQHLQNNLPFGCNVQISAPHQAFWCYC